jgi:hypothetical protein
MQQRSSVDQKSLPRDNQIPGLNLDLTIQAERNRAYRIHDLRK